jgi:hypothetical protein
MNKSIGECGETQTSSLWPDLRDHYIAYFLFHVFPGWKNIGGDG